VAQVFSILTDVRIVIKFQISQTKTEYMADSEAFISAN